MDTSTSEQEADMPTEVISVEEGAESFVLVGERCDANASGSEAATVRVWVSDESPLHFCNHHARRHLEAFVSAGYRIEAPEGILSF